jgi:hypothetical protein
MNRVPAMVGTIERRILINYRVAPEALERLLPPPFRPQLIEGVGVAGICMIRLADLRPLGAPAMVGMTTENAAHRVAVEWDGPAGPCHGVYIPRRDTSSRTTVLLGGRLFPGEHHRAHFEMCRAHGTCDATFTSLDGSAHAAITARPAAALPPSSVFVSLEAASAFFESGSLGYSATRRPGRFEGLELQCARWHVEPLLVSHAESSLFEDPSVFSSGDVEFDSALIMRDIPATWRAREALVNTPQCGDPKVSRPAPVPSAG